MARASRIHARKAGERDRFHAVHAPEADCIGKGKARARYEFGVKASFATCARAAGGQVVPGALTLPGTPHDRQSLAARLDRVARILSRAVRRANVDRGCHGLDREGLDAIVSHSRGITSPTIRREMRRRARIEPVPGHMQGDGPLERNHLHGPEGDAVSAMLSAIGHTCRLLLAWVGQLLLRPRLAMIRRLSAMLPPGDPSGWRAPGPPGAKAIAGFPDPLPSNTRIPQAG